jgi:hypothetical protein
LRKNANFFTENWQKSQKIVFITSTPDVPADDDRPVHLELDDDAGEDAAADGDVAGERALLVDEVALARLESMFKF